jgi:bifunctional non-homologous end joining protein LigD
MTLEISHPEKKIFTRYTKQEYVEYYERIADVMVPHVEHRLISMYRFPNGASEKGFYQKDRPGYFPNWIDHKLIRKDGEAVDYVVCNDKRSLVYVASQVAEIHIGTSRTNLLRYPDKMMFDLDPPDGTLASMRTVIRKLGDLLRDIGVDPYLMTTGKRGYHVAVPLKPEQNNSAVRSFALKIAEALEQDDPVHITTELIKEKRGKRIFIDVNRNSTHQTSIAPYSVRAVPKASVALPLEWKELGSVAPGGYDIGKTVRRLDRKQDPWTSFRNNQASLSQVIRRLKK